MRDTEDRSPSHSSSTEQVGVSVLRKRLGRICDAYLTLALTILALVFVAGYFASHSYLADLSTNFRLQYLGLGIVACAVAALQQRLKTLICLIILTFPQGAQVLPYYVPPKFLHSKLSPRSTLPGEHHDSNSAANSNDVLRVLSFNVLYTNDQYSRAVELVKTTLPEVVVALECTPEWYDALREGLGDDYPYASGDVFPNWTGNRIFSRFPLKAATDDLSFRFIPESEFQMAVTFQWQGQTVFVTAVHAASPISVRRFQLRNKELTQIGSISRQIVGPAIVAGDFNCTSGSPYFRDLVQQSGFADTRQGFGWQPSWPSWLPASLRIPIDHVLVNEYWEVLHREIGPDFGSDHLPVIVDLRLRSSN